MVPDIDRLIAEVAARHGVLLKPDDAAFALVTLNRLVLEQALREIENAVRRNVAELDAGAARLQSRAGGVIGQELRQAILEMKRELAASGDSRVRQRYCWFRMALAAVVTFAAGIGVGILLK